MADQTSNVVLTANVSNYQQGMAQSAQSTNTVIDSINKLNTALDGLTRRVGHKIELVSAAQLATLTGMTAAAARFEQQTDRLRGITVLTNQSFNAYSRSIDQLRQNFGVTTQTAVQLVTQLRAVATSSQDLNQMGATMVRLSALTGESLTGLTTALISLERQMGTVGTDSTTRLASALAKVSADAGVSAQSIADFAQSIAPVSRAAGLSQQQVLGFSAAFVKAGQDGYAAGNAFNKMLTDITRAIQYGSPDLNAYANLLGVTVSQFQNMPKADAIAQIFQVINSQGAGAIKTLERFGLDGVRTYQAIQGLAQSGGLQQAVQSAVGGYSNQGVGQFNKASSEAMSGLSDDLAKLKQTFQVFAEGIGATFLPFVDKMVQGLTAVGKAANTILGPISSLVGAIGGLGAIGLGAIGLLVSNFSKLAIAGTAVQLWKSLPMQGARNAFATARGSGIPFPAEAASYLSGVNGRGQPLSSVQRGLYGAGSAIGGALGGLSARWASPAGGPGVMSRVSSVAGWGIEQLGSFVRYGLEPLYPSNMRNSFNRSTPFGAGADRLFEALRSGGQALQAGGGLRDAVAATRATAALNGLTGASTAQAGAFRALATETAQFGVALMRAGAGVGLGVAGGVGRMAFSGMRSAGSALMGLAGGPLGLAMLGGMGAYYLSSTRNQQLGDIATASDQYAAGNAYKSALGEATIATTTFANVVTQNAKKLGETGMGSSNVSMAQATKVTQADVTNAMRSEVTDKNLIGMSPKQAAQYYQTARGKFTAADTQLFKQDLIKVFGGATASQILGQTNNGRIDASGLYTPIASANGGWQSWLGLSNDNVSNAAKAAGATGRSVLSGLSAQDASRYQIASMNSAIKAAKENPGRIPAIAAALANQFGMGTDDQARKDLESYLRGAVGNKDAMKMLKSGNLSGLQELGPEGAQVKIKSGQLSNALQYMFSNAGGFDINATSFSPQQTAQQTIANNYRALGGLTTTTAGSLIFGGGIPKMNQALSNSVNASINQQGNVSLQYNAANQLVATLNKTTGSYEDTVTALEQLKAQIGDTSDPLFQLADAAKSAAQAQMAFAQIGYSSQQRASSVLSTARGALTIGADSTGVGAAARQQALQQMTTEANNIYQRFYQVVSASREFDVSRLRSQQDYTKQITRSETDFATQQRRYLRNYNIQRTQSLQDYQKSRLRAEQDYSYQVLQMAKQTAISAYNVYQRVTVQQSWSGTNLGQNLADQNRRMSEQISNLQKARQLGLSGQAIQLLGLNETQNAQQLARLLQDLYQNPTLIKQYNDMAKQRLALGQKLVTDQDNLQWQQYQHNFTVNQQRAAQDFNISMKRQAQQFAISLADMRYDFNLSMSRAQQDFSIQMQRQSEDFNRMATEITGDMDTIAQKAIKTLTGEAQKQAQALYDVYKQMAKTLPQLQAQILQQINQTGGGVPGAVGGSGPQPKGANQKLVQNMAAAYGWGSGAEWGALYKVLMRESGFQNTAQNPTSTAYGMFQFLDSTWATVGGRKTSDPNLQTQYGLKYIKQRYGDPINAWQHELDYGWYKDGSIFNSRRVIGVGEAGAEAVLPLNANGAKFMAAVLSRYTNDEARKVLVGSQVPQRVGTTIYHTQVDQGTRIEKVTVQSQDPDDMLKKIQSKQRMQKLVSPK